MNQRWRELLEKSMELEEEAIKFADPSDEESIRAWKLLHDGNSNAIKQMNESEDEKKNRLITIGTTVVKILATVLLNIVSFKVIRSLFFAEKDPDDPKVLLTNGEKNLASEVYRRNIFDKMNLL